MKNCNGRKHDDNLGSVNSNSSGGSVNDGSCTPTPPQLQQSLFLSKGSGEGKKDDRNPSTYLQGVSEHKVFHTQNQEEKEVETTSQ